MADANDRDAMLGDGRATLGAGHLSDGPVGVGEVLREGEGNRAEKVRSGTVPRRARFSFWMSARQIKFALVPDGNGDVP